MAQQRQTSVAPETQFSMRIILSTWPCSPSAVVGKRHFSNSPKWSRRGDISVRPLFSKIVFSIVLLLVALPEEHASVFASSSRKPSLVALPATSEANLLFPSATRRKNTFGVLAPLSSSLSSSSSSLSPLSSSSLSSSSSQPSVPGDSASVVKLSEASKMSLLPSKNPTPPPPSMCTYSLQLFFLQDISQSYEDDLPNLNIFLPIFFDDLLVKFPDSRFALATFSDYPMPDVGWVRYFPRDHCFRLEVGFTEQTADITDAVKHLSILSGRDDPEAQLAALQHAAMGNYFDTRISINGDPSAKQVRLIVLSTDAEFHQAGDLAAEAGRHDKYRRSQTLAKYFANDEPFTIRPNDGDSVLDCKGNDLEDYPSEDQVVSSLLSNDISVLFLVTEDQLPLYSSFAARLRTHGVFAIVAPIENDSSNILQSLNTGLEEVFKLLCPEDSMKLTTTTTTTTTATTTITTVIASTLSSDSLSTPSQPTMSDTIVPPLYVPSAAESTEPETTDATDETQRDTTDEPTESTAETTAVPATVPATVPTTEPSSSSTTIDQPSSTSTVSNSDGVSVVPTSIPTIVVTPDTSSSIDSNITESEFVSSTTTPVIIAAAGGGASVGVIVGASAGAAAAVGAAVLAANALVTGGIFGGASSAATAMGGTADGVAHTVERQFEQTVTPDMFA